MAATLAGRRDRHAARPLTRRRGRLTRTAPPGTRSRSYPGWPRPRRPPGHPHAAHIATRAVRCLVAPDASLRFDHGAGSHRRTTRTADVLSRRRSPGGSPHGGQQGSARPGRCALSRSSAPQVLERTERETAQPDAAPASRRRDPWPPRPSPPRAAPACSPDAGCRTPRPARPLWFAALVAGALLAAAPGVIGRPRLPAPPPTTAWAAADISLTGGIDDAGVRRSITEAEAQAWLGELAAPRRARTEGRAAHPGRPDDLLPPALGPDALRPRPRRPLGTPIYAAADGVVLKAGRGVGIRQRRLHPGRRRERPHLRAHAVLRRRGR